jgi:hypothetical protein
MSSEIAGNGADKLRRRERFGTEMNLGNVFPPLSDDIVTQVFSAELFEVSF